ncbi:TfuA-like protein [Streptomyces sp. NPDC059003]|uniref:TfuA-like protein n=1 Tax=Streptomyces sp. NPDC059003 TaxID=3346691 RepID=UPI0036CF86B8
MAKEVVAELLPHCVVHSPVKHGDFLRADLTEGDIALVVDGLYHGNPPIRHKEILLAISRGVTVVGAASMGALRAAELHPYGMIGIGRVFEMYRDGVIDADDEVAVVHTEEPHWRILSEALVNIRHTLILARESDIVDERNAAELLEISQHLSYARRSWASIIRESKVQGEEMYAAAMRVQRFAATSSKAVNLKFQDAMAGIRFVKTLPISPEGLWPDRNWTEGWHTAYLQRWIHQFSGRACDSRFVSLSARYDYQRLFAADQPARWRRYALSTISGESADKPFGELEERALAVAEQLGISLPLLSESQIGRWLTPEEVFGLADREKILAVLVRSTRFSGELDAPDSRIILPDKECVRLEISASMKFNEQVERRGFAKHIDHLKREVLIQHLKKIWNKPSSCGGHALHVAAWDRGFTSGDEATQALRPFFLRHYHRSLGSEEREG